MQDELSVAFGFFELQFGGGSGASSATSGGACPPGSSTGKPAGERKLAYVFNDVPYTCSFLLKAFERHAGDWDLAESREERPDALVLQIDEYEEIHWERVLSGRLVASSYCVRKGLTRKANFAKHISKVIEKRPGSLLRTAVPRTIALNTWTDGGAGAVAGFIDRCAQPSPATFNLWIAFLAASGCSLAWPFSLIFPSNSFAPWLRFSLGFLAAFDLLRFWSPGHAHAASAASCAFVGNC